MNDLKLSYRKFKISDAKRLALLANNSKIAENMRDSFPYPYKISDAKSFIRNIPKHEEAMIWAVCLDQELIGALGVHMLDDVMRYSAELGYWLGEDYWNQGICTQMLTEMLPHIFRRTELVRIFANVFDSNPSSVRVLQKVGFTSEGIQRRAIFKLGKFHDAVMLSVLRDEILPMTDLDS